MLIPELCLNLLFSFPLGSHSPKRPTSTRETITSNKGQGLMSLLCIFLCIDNRKIITDRFINIIAVLHCKKLAIWSRSTFNSCPYIQISVVSFLLSIFKSCFVQKNSINNESVCLYISLEPQNCFR